MNRPSNTRTSYNAEASPSLHNCDSIDWGYKIEDPMEAEPSFVNLSSVPATRGILKVETDPPSKKLKTEAISYYGQLESRRVSCCSVSPEDNQVISSGKRQHRVTFSKCSSLSVYRPDPVGTKKSYDETERRKFKYDALQDAIRIKMLVRSRKGTSSKDAFKSLLRERMIAPEEILGIEHFLSGRPGQKVVQERRDHMNAVVAIAKCLVHDEDSSKKLGEFAAKRTIKSGQVARRRAAMAA